MAEVEGFKVGDAMSDDTFIGPLFCTKHVQFMQELVDDAVAKGARLACGGQRPTIKSSSPLAGTLLFDRLSLCLSAIMLFCIVWRLIGVIRD